MPGSPPGIFLGGTMKSKGTIIETKRLILRRFQDSDLAPFAQLNSNPEVMRYFPAPLSSKESDALAHEINRRIDANGYGFWAAERKEDGVFIGFVGLNKTRDNMPFPPSVEIGWRLDRPYWGNGYATEAAKASLKFAFETLKEPEVISFTAVPNKPSQQVMKRIGMKHEGEFFDHPALEDGHCLKSHIIYKISNNLNL